MQESNFVLQNSHIRVSGERVVLFPCDRETVNATGGSFVWALGCHVGGREFNSSRTNTHGL